MMFLIILFISNLFIGTPVKYNIMYVNLIVNIVTLIYIIIKYIKDKEKISINKIDICVIIIVFSTFIPLVFNSYLRLADTVEYILRYITVFNIYMLTKMLVKNNKKFINTIFDVIIFSSIILIIFGIDMMTQNIFKGFYNILGIPEIYNESNYRIGSLFKYPNTLGIFLVVSIILSIISYISKEEKKYKNIYAVTAFIQIFALVMTYSRWSILVLLISFIMLILFMKDKKIRQDIIKIIIISSISAGIYYIIFNKMLDADNYIGIYIVMLVQSIIYYIIMKYLENIKIKSGKRIDISILVIIIIITLSLIYSIMFSSNGVTLFENLSDKATYRKQNILVESNKEYTIEFDIKSYSNRKESFKIQCKEVDENGKDIKVHEKRFDNYYGNITINFTTDESAKTMSIVFLAAKTNSTGLLEIKSVKINGREEKMSYGIIPIELVNRVTKLKTDTASFSGRLEYYKDSIGIIKNNFFTGAGGYAWRNSGHETASQGIAEHSYPLQLFIQNGIISFIAYVILIIVVVKNLRKIFEKDRNIEKIGLHVLVLVLALHSLFDFDMYFLNILIIFYVFIAMISSEDRDYDIMLNHRYSYLYIIVLIFALYFNFGEVVTSVIGNKINNYNYLEAKIVMVPYDYTFRTDKINYLSTIKNECQQELSEDEQISIINEIVKEEEYIIEKEKNGSYDDINRLIINYIDIINNDNEKQILDKISNKFEKLESNKELVYQTIESRFKRKYFNENIDNFLEKIKEENGLSEKSVDDNN